MPESLDLVMSNLTMHWINDLPGLSSCPSLSSPQSIRIAGTMIQIRRALRPGEMPPLPCPAPLLLLLASDGLFLASMLGGDTLIELRHAITVSCFLQCLQLIQILPSLSIVSPSFPPSLPLLLLWHLGLLSPPRFPPFPKANCSPSGSS